MIEQFINFVIRPPRAEYNPDQYLWEKEFSLAGRTYQRLDLELKNARGHTLQCSHYIPSPFPEDTSLPCVIYCHGNSGCRADANEAAVILLPSNITVFTLDFSGSGLSDGDYVSLGWHEKDDLKVVVSHLRNNKQISHIGLWGRSMGAVTSLLYGAEDPSIAGMVLDSAFSNLYDLMMELVDVYKIRLPKFTVKMAVQYMRRVIEKKAKFDIMDLNCLLVAPKTFIPALIGHASEDKFIQPRHSDLIFKSYAGDKNVIKFNGDHNSSRPQFFYDSVSIFFYNVLRPPQVPSALSKLEKYYDLGDLKIGSDVDKSLLYDIISSLRSAASGAASSSSAPPPISSSKSVDELFSEVATVTTVEPMFRDNTIHGNDEPNNDEDKLNCQTEECCSYTSSNRESWGRCSSLGGSDEESYADFRADNCSQIDVFATPLRSMKEKSLDDNKEEEKEEKTKEKGESPDPMKGAKSDKLDKWEAFSRRFRLCILKGATHRRHGSS
ncbi:esterase/lipase domain protein [Senna tora]|uniref:Esterase/lipase domain protein n=1 Tax=Senna tora TaxID=362788 RepID=A0A834SPN5_9FABA|nr:esterase/lipase domain protein [Senna tora]